MDSSNVNAIRLAIELGTILLFGSIWIAVVTFLRLKKGKDAVYLLFFTVFYVYLFKTLDYTLFRFQSLLLLRHFAPDLILRGQTAGQEMNFLPLMTLTRAHMRTSLLNVLLLMPFGFGLPFITNFRMKKVVIVGALFSVALELLQLITGLLATITFRIVDINDVIFNTAGVAIGYVLFVGFVRIYRPASRNWTNPILRYVSDRPQVERQQARPTR